MAIISVENLQKRYGKKRGVSDVSFAVEENEIFGMVGPNGAGKTTTIECTLGIRKRDSGTVRILGFDPLVERNRVFSNVGIQLQETSYPDKARVSEICSLMASLYEKPLPYQDLLKEFELDEQRKAFISDLSGGQRQRLAILLALIPDPKLVVFDELTTGLDPQARRAMWAYIKDLKKRGITVFLTTHFMEEAEQLCDTLAVVVDGQITRIDTVPNIIKSCSLKSRIEIATDNTHRERLKVCLNNLPHSIDEYGQLIIDYDTTHSLVTIIRSIEENNIPIKNLSVKTPTLEDAYLKLTVSELEDK
jgi:ABC-2 type transport system ATP-binding protein